MYRVWVFVHILGVAGFLVAHGVSIGMALGLRRERAPERIRALLKLSSGYISGAYVSLLVLLIGGIVAGFLGHWWDRGWIWASLVVLVGLVVAMGLLGTRFYDRVRLAVGDPPLYGAKKMTEQPPPATPEELEALLSSSRPLVLVVVGGIGLLLILWLMVLKPF